MKNDFSQPVQEVDAKKIDKSGWTRLVLFVVANNYMQAWLACAQKVKSFSLWNSI